jgi:PLP dependent protein
MTTWMSPISSSEQRDNRKSELAANLEEVRQRIRAACTVAGRDPGEVTLIGVTKTWPASDARLLRELGVRDIGENRDAEAAPKAAACADLDITWHFVGQLQTNKCRSVARYAGVVHSVDRERLVRALGAAARAAGRTVTCLVQVNLDPAPDRSGRGGVAPGGAVALGKSVAAEPGLLLGGVMAVAPLGSGPAAAFARLGECAGALRAAEPSATVISAGMSGDLEAAIEAGATHLRIGTALLGKRQLRVR